MGGVLSAGPLMNVGQVTRASLAVTLDPSLVVTALSLDTDNSKGQEFDTNFLDTRAPYITKVPTVLGYSYFENATGTEWMLTDTVNDNGWNYQTFGAWEHGRDDTYVELGAFSVGAVTSPVDIPVSGNATYQGKIAGVYIDATGTADFSVSASFSATADFAARSVSFASTNTITYDVLTFAVAPEPNLDITGTLAYATGSNALQGSFSTANGLSGTSVARFYGPQAQELGGTFTLIPSAPVPGVYMGAFGGAR